ncbi:hypothetical protein TNCV_4169891 [Trichonephila clavipes]|nr:hypothetical protein TNCV_4169891 [Trichonephila clavipes]
MCNCILLQKCRINIEFLVKLKKSSTKTFEIVTGEMKFSLVYLCLKGVSGFDEGGKGWSRMTNVLGTQGKNGESPAGPSKNLIPEMLPVKADKLQKCVTAEGNYFEDGDRFNSCQVIYSQFGLAIHQNDHQARRRFIEWAQNEIAVVPDFHKRILFSDEAHFWLNGYFNKQNCYIWSEANPQVYVETPLHPEKLTVWCALWAGGILLQKR